MVKTNELFKVQYVAPKVKEFEVKVQKGVLDGSQFNSTNGTEYYGIDQDEDV